MYRPVALVSLFSILTFSSTASADFVTGIGGIFGLTHFSRANCLNNESISWDNTATQVMRVSSKHRLIKSAWGKETIVQDHSLTAGWTAVQKGGPLFDGVKAIHWKEGLTRLDWEYVHRWKVYGEHRYYRDANPLLGTRRAYSFATWCGSDVTYNDN